MSNGDNWNVLDALTSIDELQRQTNELLGKLLEHFPGRRPATVTIPLDPETLNNLIEAQRLGRGTYKTMTYQVSVLIPANDTKTVPFYIPKGFTCTRRDPLKLHFSYHSPDIKVTGWVGGHPFTAEDQSCAVDLELSFGEFYVKHEEDTVEIRIKNNTNNDTTMTMYVRPSLMANEFYEDVYAPLMSKGYTTLQELIETISAAGAR